MKYKIGDKQIKLLCKHAYHSECITKWLGINKVSQCRFKAKVFWTLQIRLFISCLVLFLMCFVRYVLFATMRYLERNQGINRSREKENHCSIVSCSFIFFLFFMGGLVSFSFCTRRFSQGTRQFPHSPQKFCLLKKPYHLSFYSKITWVLSLVLLSVTFAPLSVFMFVLMPHSFNQSPNNPLG